MSPSAAPRRTRSSCRGPERGKPTGELRGRSTIGGNSNFQPRGAPDMAIMIIISFQNGISSPRDQSTGGFRRMPVSCRSRKLLLGLEHGVAEGRQSALRSRPRVKTRHWRATWWASASVRTSEMISPVIGSTHSRPRRERCLAGFVRGAVERRPGAAHAVGMDADETLVVTGLMARRSRPSVRRIWAQKVRHDQPKPADALLALHGDGDLVDALDHGLDPVGRWRQQIVDTIGRNGTSERGPAHGQPHAQQVARAGRRPRLKSASNELRSALKRCGSS